MKQFRRIGVLTSGGDAPGMNAAVRAVIRSAIGNGIEVCGILEGYKGLVEDNVRLYDSSDMVKGIIERPGTVIYTARCEEFATKEGMQKALETCKKHQIDGVIAIGGDGTFRGATDLSKHGIPTIGIPGTIDNDIAATDYTIGFNSALDVDMRYLDSLRATNESHARCCVVEVMGRHAGDIALQLAVAVGAYAVAVPEFKFDEDKLIHNMIESRKNGRRSYLIIVSEGLPGYAEKLTDIIFQKTGITSRYCNPAHAQRGGIPTIIDRILGSEMGEYAVNKLLEGQSDIVICRVDDKLCSFDINKALTLDKMLKNKLTPEQISAIPDNDRRWMEERCRHINERKKALYDLTYALQHQYD